MFDAFTAPIQVTAAYLDEISVGEIPPNVSEEYQGDFNVIIQRLNRLIHNMRDITHIAERMANGDLTIEAHERSEQDVLMHALQKMLNTLNRTVREVKIAAEALAIRSRDMSTIAEHMSQSASEQAAAAEEVSSSMEEMAANIAQNAHNAEITEQIAVQSAENARKGQEAVAKIITAMESIAERILSVQEIADQTNILSLNATIEAAKAQEYGKGFAVVASSVRDLAQRSRDAATDIDHQVRSCVHLSKEAGTVLQQLGPNSKETAEFVQNISAASQEQRSGAAHINQALQQLDSVTQHNAATAEQLFATAEALATRAEQLQNAMQFFQVNVEEQPLPEEEEFAKLFQAFLHAPESDKRRVVDLLKQVTPPASTPPLDEGSEENVQDADLILGQDEPSARDARDEEEFEPY